MARDPGRSREDRVLVGDRLWQARKRLGLDQGPLAQEFGLVQSDISEWETGARQPPLHVIWRLAERLGVTVEDILRPPGDPYEQQTYEVARRQEGLPAGDTPAKRHARWTANGRVEAAPLKRRPVT